MPGPWVTATSVEVALGYQKDERLLVDAQGAYRGALADRMCFSYGVNCINILNEIGSTRSTGIEYYDDKGRYLRGGETKISAVKSASDFILIADSAADGISDFTLYPYEDDRFPNEYWSAGDVHRGGANVVFCDGHVQWYLKTNLVPRYPWRPEEAVKQQRWNIFNEPAIKQ